MSFFTDSRLTVAVGPVELQVLNGPEAGRRLRIADFPCMLGRGGRSRIILQDLDNPPALSREHATLSLRGPDLVVTDHSVNGTRLGDRWLARGETAILTPHHELRLGPTLRLRRIDGAAASKSPAPIPIVQIVQERTSKKECDVRGATPASPQDLRGLLTAMETLRAAWRRVELNRGAAGPDNVTIQEYTMDAGRRLTDLQKRLQCGRYEPLPPRLFAAPKRSGGVRKIAILTVQDRIVQQALHTALQPILEPLFPPCSYAYRPGACAHDALRAVDSLLRQGMEWIAETDIAAFFDRILHGLLLEKLGKAVPDPFTLTLVSRCLAVSAAAPGIGIPQGAATSPLFSNLYLAEFDARMLQGGFHPVRYGDDLLFSCASRGQAQAALAEAEGFLRSRLQLALKPEKTRVAHLAQGFTFLGFHFSQKGRRPSPQSIQSLNERLEEASPAQAAAVARGWKNYFGPFPESDTEASSSPNQKPSTQELTSSPSSHSSAFPRVLLPEEIDRFLTLFGGRQDAHARMSCHHGRRVFTPCAGPLTPDLVRMHLAGQETLSAYLVDDAGMLRMLVLDMDAVTPRAPERREEPGADQSVSESPDMDPVIAFAGDLCRVCRGIGLPAFLEDSGRRGRHLWIFFEAPLPAEKARRLGRLLAARAGFPRPGVRLEIFPRHAQWPGPELGDAVKLPLGVHPASGRRCFFLDAEGAPMADPGRALERLRTVPSEAVEELLGVLSRWTEAGAPPAVSVQPGGLQPQGEVTRLVERCSVVRALVEMARQRGHLRHTHNLILLYTAGRLGEEGAAFIHRTLASCRNYDSSICQSYINKLEPNHPPLTCRRIREWLEEEGERSLCDCSKARRCPIETTSKREARNSGVSRPSPPAPYNEPGQDWQDVSDDLFKELS